MEQEQERELEQEREREREQEREMERERERELEQEQEREQEQELMPLYNHRSSALIGRVPLPVTMSDKAQRHTAHVRSVSTNKAKKVAKSLTVKARRWK